MTDLPETSPRARLEQLGRDLRAESARYRADAAYATSTARAVAPVEPHPAVSAALVRLLDEDTRERDRARWDAARGGGR